MWVSTEHNADVYAVANWLLRLTGEAKYAEAASKARRLLDASFRGDHFLLGRNPDGKPADGAMLALDVQLWPWMAVPDAPAEWRRALHFAETHLAVPGGFDFNGDRDGLWVEGTAQAALAYRMSGDIARSREILAGLRSDQTESGLLNATRNARVTTGLSIDPTGTNADFFLLSQAPSWSHRMGRAGGNRLESVCRKKDELMLESAADNASILMIDFGLWIGLLVSARLLTPSRALDRMIFGTTAGSLLVIYVVWRWHDTLPRLSMTAESLWPYLFFTLEFIAVVYTLMSIVILFAASIDPDRLIAAQARDARPRRLSRRRCLHLHL